MARHRRSVLPGRHGDVAPRRVAAGAPPTEIERIRVLQRAIGNGALERAIRPRALQRRVLSRQIERTVAALNARLIGMGHQTVAELGPRGAQLQRLPVVLQQLDAFLRRRRIGYRLGGSLSAFLQGAARIPGDIDVEISSPEQMAALAGAVSEMGAGWRGRVTPNTAGRPLLIVATHERAPDFDFDFVSEADPELQIPLDIRPGMEISEGETPGGGVVSWPELVVNYLNRLATNPAVAATKGDAAQIGQLLHRAGVATPAQAWQLWDTELTSLLRNPALQVPQLAPQFQGIVGPRPQMAAPDADVEMQDADVEMQDVA